jgi:hypothetical protein
MALIGNAIYEVTDPVHPRLLCEVANTKAHLFTGDTFEYIRRSGDQGTEVVLHSMGSGNERVVSGWPIKLLDDSGRAMGDWTPDGDTAASLVPAVDGAGRAVLQVWLFAQSQTNILYQFLTPKQPEQSTPTLAFSSDGQYLVSGWPASPSGYPLYVFQIGKHDPVQTLDVADTIALWSRTGHTLYLSSPESKSTRSWTPEFGFTPLPGASDWTHLPSLSPDGAMVAYTAHADLQRQTGTAVYVYDSKAEATRLISQARSEVTFVKDGWVWYIAEQSCGECPGGTAALGPIYAMNLSTPVEQEVAFAAGESPFDTKLYWGPAEFWPNS